jgi:hypothetical protein
VADRAGVMAVARAAEIRTVIARVISRGTNRVIRGATRREIRRAGWAEALRVVRLRGTRRRVAVARRAAAAPVVLVGPARPERHRAPGATASPSPERCTARSVGSSRGRCPRSAMSKRAGVR